MPRRSKGPRLYLQPERRRDDGSVERATWVIRDGTVKRSTGASARESEKAARALADYIFAKSKRARVSNRDPSQVRIADVIAVYADDVAGKHARPNETAARLGKLIDHLGDMTLDRLNKQTCAAYVEMRDGKAVARRELEDLRAAIRYHWDSGLCSSLTPVVLPERGMPRERWLTRSEAARLIWAAWRYREVQNYRGTQRRTRQHIARFILVALYTGTRAGAICGAALEPTAGRGWIDLDNGVFYRRAAGVRETKKRQTPVRLPPRLLAHLRRWQRLYIAERAVVEFNRQPVKRINKAFRAVRSAAGLGSDVTPHTFRHTCCTWLAQAAVPLWEAAGFVGMTVQTFERMYGHHHPDHQSKAVNAFKSSPTVTDRIAVNETRFPRASVIDLSGKRRLS